MIPAPSASKDYAEGCAARRALSTEGEFEVQSCKFKVKSLPSNLQHVTLNLSLITYLSFCLLRFNMTRHVDRGRGVRRRLSLNLRENVAARGL
jgi:hypothetical protein